MYQRGHMYQTGRNFILFYFHTFFHSVMNAPHCHKKFVNCHKNSQVTTNNTLQATTTNEHKRPKTTCKRPPTTIKRPQTTSKATTNYQQTTKNYQQTTINGHTCISNQKVDVSFLLPATSNYKDHLDFEKHLLSVRGNCLSLSQYKQNRICLLW